VVREGGDIVDEAERRVGRAKLLGSLGARQTREDTGDMRIHHWPVGDPDHVGLEALALRQIRLVEEPCAEFRPLAFVLNGDQY
jgi:hypothetical protein